MRPQSLGRHDRLLNRAAWHLAVSKRERPALGRFATRCLRNAGGSAVAPTKLDIRASTRCYCSDARKPQSLVLLVWSYHRRCCLCLQRTFAMPQRQVRRSARRYLMDRRHSLAALLCFLRLTFIMGWFQCTTPSPLANVGNGASGRAVRPGVAQSSLEPDEFPRQHLSGRNHDRHCSHSQLSKSKNSAVGL